MKLRRTQATLCVLALGLSLAACDSDEPKAKAGTDTESSSSTPTVEVSETVTVDGTALAGTASSGEDPDPPSGLAPTLTGSGFDGSTVTIKPGASGKPMAVIFVAHWCQHCQLEVPRLMEASADGLTLEGVEMAFVSTSVNPDRGNYPPSTWLDNLGVVAPVIADDKDLTAAKAYGVGGFPFMVFLDAEGKVTGRFSGEMEVDVLKARFKKAATAKAVS